MSLLPRTPFLTILSSKGCLPTPWLSPSFVFFVDLLLFASDLLICNYLSCFKMETHPLRLDTNRYSRNTSVVQQQFKPTSQLPYPLWVLAWVLTAPLRYQLLANGLGRVADDSSAWACASQLGGPAAPGPWPLTSSWTSTDHYDL